jgi:hypothetical protein
MSFMPLGSLSSCHFLSGVLAWPLIHRLSGNLSNFTKIADTPGVDNFLDVRKTLQVVSNPSPRCSFHFHGARPPVITVAAVAFFPASAASHSTPGS